MLTPSKIPSPLGAYTTQILRKIIMANIKFMADFPEFKLWDCTVEIDREVLDTSKYKPMLYKPCPNTLKIRRRSTTNLFEKMKTEQREYCLKKIEKLLNTPAIIKLIDEVIAEEEKDLKENGHY
jgi:hypothetical protein